MCVLKKKKKEKKQSRSQDRPEMGTLAKPGPKLHLLPPAIVDNITSQLESPYDAICLALTCRHFLRAASRMRQTVTFAELLEPLRQPRASLDAATARVREVSSTDDASSEESGGSARPPRPPVPPVSVEDYFEDYFEFVVRVGPPGRRGGDAAPCVRCRKWCSTSKTLWRTRLARVLPHGLWFGDAWRFFNPDAYLDRWACTSATTPATCPACQWRLVSQPGANPDWWHRHRTELGDWIELSEAERSALCAAPSRSPQLTVQAGESVTGRVVLELFGDTTTRRDPGQGDNVAAQSGWR